MFNKITTFTVDSNAVEVLDNEFVKTASEIILPEGHQYDPDFVYMKVRAVSAGEYWGCNKNADFFPEEELKKNFKTFFDAHVFKNHENKEVEKAIGDVLDAIWNDEMKYVELFIRVDKRIAPTIARGFEKGFMTDVSMGCKIDHSVCSICGNVAKTQSQYCEHIKYQKHSVLSNGDKVFEINVNPRFHDISAVLNGADRTAKMTGLFISGTKVAFNEEKSMQKCASTMEDALFDMQQDINTYSGQTHIDATGIKVLPKFNKVASNVSVGVDHLPLFTKTASEDKVSKTATELEKIAEIKKRIKGNVLAVAKSRVELEEMKNISNGMEEMRGNGGIKPLGEPVLDRFAGRINEISDKEEVMAEQVLTCALKMLSLAGVNLSPAEFVHVMRRVIGLPVGGTVRRCPQHMDRAKIVRDFDNSVAMRRDAVRAHNIPTMFNVMRHVHGLKLPTMGDYSARRPAMIIIEKTAGCKGVTRPEVTGLNLEDKVLDVCTEIIDERSLHLPHMTKRAMDAEYEAGIEKEAAARKPYCMRCEHSSPERYVREGHRGYSLGDNRDKDAEYLKCSKKSKFKHKEDRCDSFSAKIEKNASNKDNISIIDHYYSYLIGTPAEKLASEDVYREVERQAYASYQNLVADYVDSTDYQADLYRFAHEIGVDNESMEKCAKNIMKSMNVGLGTYLYSKYQGVKARQGRPQSTLNRTVAENPEATAMAGTLVAKGLMDNKGKVKKGMKNAATKAMKYVAKTASENIDIYLGDELEAIEDGLADIDMFKDSVINVKLAKEYTPKQIELIKTASVMYAQGRQDLCDNLLSIEGLGYNAMNDFLQVCEDTFVEELEKKASIGKVVSRVVGKATKAIGSGITKAKPIMQSATNTAKQVGGAATTAFNNNATPGMKKALGQVGAGVNKLKTDVGNMSTGNKVGLGLSATGVGLAGVNTMKNKQNNQQQQ